MKNDFKNFPLKTKRQKKIIFFLHGAKNGEKAKLFRWLALILEQLWYDKSELLYIIIKVKKSTQSTVTTKKNACEILTQFLSTYMSSSHHFVRTVELLNFCLICFNCVTKTWINIFFPLFLQSEKEIIPLYKISLMQYFGLQTVIQTFEFHWYSRPLGGTHQNFGWGCAAGPSQTWPSSKLEMAWFWYLVLN